MRAECSTLKSCLPPDARRASSSSSVRLATPPLSLILSPFLKLRVAKTATSMLLWALSLAAGGGVGDGVCRTVADLGSLAYLQADLHQHSLSADVGGATRRSVS